ncbi:MAG: aminopeptidase [Bacilli bacterium]|nr:aminopeptidase [Bacilli bacterium]
MKKSDLKKFAKLIVRQGANVQKKQSVIINASVECADFVTMVVEECYKAKAKDVRVDWTYDELTKLHYKYQTVETLSEVRPWVEERAKDMVETLPARIFIMSDDPDALKDVDQTKMMKSTQARGKILKKYRDAIDNKHQWTIVGFPGAKWAKKVFPNEKEKKAKELLWDAIYKTTRLEGDPIKNWQEHAKFIHAKCDFLNNLHIKELHYKSSNGTDFKVCLTGKTLFHGGSVATIKGVVYDPNMPTEECYTSPDPKTAEGVIYATKPLSLYGTVLNNFGFRFEKGKVVEVLGGEKEKEVLNGLINIDEGASRLGEVALVPFDSPVNMTGLLFFNTLYDENACCHLALGAGFDDCIDGFEKMTEEEKQAVGLNDSMIHVDFMVGSSDLEITAKTFDGKVVPIFKNGTWA